MVAGRARRRFRRRVVCAGAQVGWFASMNSITLVSLNGPERIAQGQLRIYRRDSWSALHRNRVVNFRTLCGGMEIDAIELEVGRVAVAQARARQPVGIDVVDGLIHSLDRPEVSELRV